MACLRIQNFSIFKKVSPEYFFDNSQHALKIPKNDYLRINQINYSPVINFPVKKKIEKMFEVIEKETILYLIFNSVWG